MIEVADWVAHRFLMNSKNWRCDIDEDGAVVYLDVDINVSNQEGRTLKRAFTQELARIAGVKSI